jgi:RNA recognition motif-containing protein
MPVSEQAKAAITAMNEKEVYGRKISLKEAVEKQQERFGNFQRPKREYRDNDQEIDGNRW